MNSPKIIVKLNEWLESEDFYELCQSYRNAHVTDQRVVSAKYEVLKASIILRVSNLLDIYR